MKSVIKLFRNNKRPTGKTLVSRNIEECESFIEKYTQGNTILKESVMIIDGNIEDVTTIDSDGFLQLK